MKKFLFLSFIFFTAYSLEAQKIFQTKSGKVSFFSSTPVEDIKANNYQVDSKLSTNGQVVFLMAVRGFVFRNALMQEHFNENYMESTKYPKASFFGNITNIQSVDFSKDGSYPVNITGNMEIHGVKKPLTTAGTLTIKKGKVEANSEFKLNITDFGIKGSYIGEKIAREITITLNCKYD